MSLEQLMALAGRLNAQPRAAWGPRSAPDRDRPGAARAYSLSAQEWAELFPDTGAPTLAPACQPREPA